jgi:recombinational DNA repair protein RecT
MWRKTLIKQLSKLLSKNADVFDALNEDNKDSIISDKEIIT